MVHAEQKGKRTRMSFAKIKEVLEMPDLIEVLPGTIYRVIARLSRELPVPLIAGGLLADKADVTAALSAGALCVSASDPQLWDL